MQDFFSTLAISAFLMSAQGAEGQGINLYLSFLNFFCKSGNPLKCLLDVFISPLHNSHYSNAKKGTKDTSSIHH